MAGHPAPPDARNGLRSALRAQRRALTAAERIAAALAATRHLSGVPGWSPTWRVAGYWAVGGELPLLGLFGSGSPVDYHLPCLAADGVLRFAPWKPGEAVISNSHGIPEPDVPEAGRLTPDAIDLVLVPLVGFTRDGHRLGQGGGWYDRSFAFLRDRPRPARPLLVGMAYALQETAAFSPEPWDVPLDYVATERELIPCAAAAEPPSESA